MPKNLVTSYPVAKERIGLFTSCLITRCRRYQVYKEIPIVDYRPTYAETRIRSEDRESSLVQERSVGEDASSSKISDTKLGAVLWFSMVRGGEMVQVGIACYVIQKKAGTMITQSLGFPAGVEFLIIPKADTGFEFENIILTMGATARHSGPS